MNNFRQPPRRSRQAIDGILGAPTRPQLQARPTAARRPASRADTFRTNTRVIGDFKRPEGYHLANGAGAQRTFGGGKLLQATKTPAEPTPSLLETTLPKSHGLGARRRARHEKKAAKKAHKSKDHFWQNHSARWWTLRSGLAVACLLLLMGGFLFTKGFFKINKVFKGGGSAAALQANVSPSLLKGEGDGRINVLLLGRGGDGHDGANLTDTILLASIDPISKKAALLSVPRDLWVSAPTGYGSSKINAVYANAKDRALSNTPNDTKKADAAGAAATEKVVESTLGVPIHYYAVVDFKAFQQAVDTVGGVTINVPETLSDSTMAWQNGGSPILARKGAQSFDGRKALMYVRSRHGSARGDFDRAERQRLFIVALTQKVLSAGTYTNPVKVSQLMDAFGDHVSTDFSINDAMRLMNIAKGINGAGIESIGLADPASNYLTTSMISGQSVVIPRAGVGNYAEIQAFVRNRLRDGYLAKENAEVMVLNGTNTPGLATKKAEELKSYGYTVTTVGDAPTKDYQKTMLADLSKGTKKYTRNYLEKRLDAKATSKLQDPVIQSGTASFVVIIGQNETNSN